MEEIVALIDMGSARKETRQHGIPPERVDVPLCKAPWLY